MLMARFFLPQANIKEGRGIVRGQELTHLMKVLRLRAGDFVTLFDNSGWEHEAVIETLTSERGELKIVESRATRCDPFLPITLAVGLTKGEKLDWVIEKATELGVTTIVPFSSNYTVPKLDNHKIHKRSERWRKIAVSAAKQCGRSRIPEVRSLCSFEKFVSESWPETLKLIFWENETERSVREMFEKCGETKHVLLAIGPEGGFSEREVELASAQGFQSVHMGRRILRSETAALAGLTILQFLWGDLS
jgi:16S rRNA (uracil1498-N3)-methyltransferase